jgi:hypothetical protein
MVSALVLRGHWVHVLVFGVPVAALAGAVAAQEIRGRRRSSGATDRVSRVGRGSMSLRIAAVGLFVAAVIHAIVIPEHFEEDALFGWFFTVLTVAQLGLTAVVAYRPDHRTVRYVALGSAAVVVLWLMSRTSGIPLGPEPWEAESFGGLDIAATIAELITAIACAFQLWTSPGHQRLAAPRVSELTT